MGAGPGEEAGQEAGAAVAKVDNPSLLPHSPTLSSLTAVYRAVPGDPLDPLAVLGDHWDPAAILGDPLDPSAIHGDPARRKVD